MEGSERRTRPHQYQGGAHRQLIDIAQDMLGGHTDERTEQGESCNPGECGRDGTQEEVPLPDHSRITAAPL